MIGVVVTFRFGNEFDEQAVRRIAESARARFEGMPGASLKGLHVQHCEARGRELLPLGLSGRSQSILY
jgi:hypothetical protein